MKQLDTFTSPVGPLMARYLALKRALAGVRLRWHIFSATSIASWCRAMPRT
jgi:hypothetical protein